jgi:hypothetical protein
MAEEVKCKGKLYFASRNSSRKNLEILMRLGLRWICESKMLAIFSTESKTSQFKNL